jgi:hypothetical protein
MIRSADEYCAVASCPVQAIVVGSRRSHQLQRYLTTGVDELGLPKSYRP